MKQQRGEHPRTGGARELTATECAAVNGGSAYGAGYTFGSIVINEPMVRAFQFITDPLNGVWW